jgi:hypothetical protein
MSLETIALIGVLTLLTASLGTDFFWVVVIKPAFQRISDQSLLETMGNIHLQSAKFMPVVFLAMFACAIILNVVSSSRSEPYLLRIGFISLAVYFALIFIGSAPINKTIISMLNGAGSQSTIRELQGRWDMYFGSVCSVFWSLTGHFFITH